MLMRRTNGQESFQRGWMEYSNGFGSLTGDFWLGNTILSALTHEAGKTFTTKVEMKFCDGRSLTHSYQRFDFDDEQARFQSTIIRVDNELDELSFSSGKYFHTASLHNSVPNCGNTHGGGGWWWSSEPNCTLVNFTGKFGCNQPYPTNMYWQSKAGGKVIRAIKSFVIKSKPN